jgi:hypothetical protein
MREFKDLIDACEEKLRLRSDEYPSSDYEWGIKEVSGIDELIEAFRHGNWSKRTGFVLGNLAFIEQVSGGNEWLAVKRKDGQWKPFDSISFYHMLEWRGENYCRDYINQLLDSVRLAPEIPDPPSNSERLRALPRMIADVTDGKQRCAISSYTIGVYIVPDDAAHFGLDIHKQLDMKTGLCRLQLKGYLRTMGTNMYASEIREIAAEANALADLISTLEQNPIVVSEEELSQWARDLAAAQLDQAVTDAARRDTQLDPTMGMV